MKETALSGERGLRPAVLIMLALTGLLFAGALASEFPAKFSLFVVVAVLLVILVAKCPEVLLALFINAGELKNNPLFRLPFVDLTVFLGLLTALGIIWGIRQKRLKFTIPPLKMYLPFLLICLISAISVMYTTAPAYGLDKLLKFAVLTGLAFFGSFYLLADNKRLRNFMIVYIIYALVLAVDVLQKSPLPGQDEIMTSLTSNYLMTGAIMAEAFMMVFLYFFMIDKSSVRRGVYLLAFSPMALYVLMLSGGRGPFLALIFTLVLTLVLAGHPASRKRSVRFWIIVVLAAGGIYLTYDYQNFTRMTSRMMMLDEGGGRSAMERIYMAKAALEAMGTMPYFFTGLGIGGFSLYYHGLDELGGMYLYPHNILLELGSEIGIFGLLSIILLLYWSFSKAYSLVKKSIGDNYYIAVTVLSIFLFTLINALKSGDINDHRLLFTVMGAIYSLDHKMNEEARTIGHAVQGKMNGVWK